MKKISLLILTFSLMTASAFSDEASKKQLAEELLIQMQTDKQIEKTYEQIKTMQSKQIQTTMQQYGSNLPQETLDRQQKSMNDMMDTMSREMSWEKMKDDFIQAYADVFTEEELSGLVQFYKSPIGQKFVEKMPELTLRLMQISQKKTELLMPEIMRKAKEASGFPQPISSSGNSDLPQTTQQK